MTAALEGGEWSAPRPGRTLPPGKARYPLHRRLGGPQGRSGRAENLVPTGIRSRRFQPVAQSLYRLSYRVHSVTCISTDSTSDCCFYETTLSARLSYGRLSLCTMGRRLETLNYRCRYSNSYPRNQTAALYLR